MSKFQATEALLWYIMLPIGSEVFRIAFRQNQSQQIIFCNTFWGLTDREKKVLEKAWAKVFAEDIFPNINEQPLSDKSLSRFRIRCYDYGKTHGVDLYRDCIEGLSDKIGEMIHIDVRIRRMNSTMIEANIRRLTRMELIYTCIANLVKYLDKIAAEFDRERFEHYLDPGDYNKVIYHSRTEDVDERMLTLLTDADELMKRCKGNYDDVTEYLLFSRCISEQTVVTGAARRLRTKEDGEMGFDLMQNPSDPDATYRKKGNKEYRGYVAIIEKSVGPNGSVVTSYQFEKNNVSDSAMLNKHLETIEPQLEKILMTVDGAYVSTENMELAAKGMLSSYLPSLPEETPP
jgi:hypothetical protein